MKRKRYGKRRRLRKRKFRKTATIGSVRRMISRGQESKWIYATPGTSTVTNATALVALLAPSVANGADRDQRNGNKITLAGLEWRVSMDAVTAACRARIVILHYKYALAALPGSGDSLSTASAANEYFSPFDPNYVPSQADVMYDRTFQLQIIGGAANVPQKKEVMIRLRKRIPVTYNDLTTAALGAINKGALIFFMYADTATGFAQASNLQYRFKDA